MLPNLSIKTIIILSNIFLMFIYYVYKRTNSNFKNDVVHYSDHYIIILIKMLHILLNPLAFEFISWYNNN